MAYSTIHENLEPRREMSDLGARRGLQNTGLGAKLVLMGAETLTPFVV
jgi:hypothetical protein